jgi:hypothetical protein
MRDVENEHIREVSVSIHNNNRRNERRYYNGDERQEHRLSPKSLELMSIYTNDEFLSIDAGVRVCLNINALNFRDIDEINELVTRNVPEAAKNVQINDRLSWLPIEGDIGADGGDYDSKFGPIIERYRKLAPVGETMIVNYASLWIKVNFSKIPEIDHEIMKKYGFGAFLISDFDKGNARINGAVRFNRVKSIPIGQGRLPPVHAAVTTDVGVGTLFRFRAVLVVYYVKAMIEKRPGEFFPNMNVITIPFYTNVGPDGISSFEIRHGDITPDTQVVQDPVGRILYSVMNAGRRFANLDWHDLYDILAALNVPKGEWLKYREKFFSDDKRPENRGNRYAKGKESREQRPQSGREDQEERVAEEEETPEPEAETEDVVETEPTSHEEKVPEDTSEPQEEEKEDGDDQNEGDEYVEETVDEHPSDEVGDSEESAEAEWTEGNREEPVSDEVEREEPELEHGEESREGLAEDWDTPAEDKERESGDEGEEPSEEE